MPSASGITTVAASGAVVAGLLAEDTVADSGGDGGCGRGCVIGVSVVAGLAGVIVLLGCWALCSCWPCGPVCAACGRTRQRGRERRRKAAAATDVAGQRLVRTHMQRVRRCTLNGEPDISICETAGCYWDRRHLSPELADMSYERFSGLYSVLSGQKCGAVMV